MKNYMADFMSAIYYKKDISNENAVVIDDCGHIGSALVLELVDN